MALSSTDMPLLFISASARASPREPGEDRLAVIQHEDALVVIVADGVGGISGGASAAELLVKLVEKALVAPAFDPRRSGAWVEVLSRADVALEADPRAGETTAVIVAVSEHGLVGVSSGDSGAWMVSAVGIDDLTRKQHRKVRLGSGNAQPVAFSRPKLDGTLLVASDGLFNYAGSDKILEIVLQKDLDQAAQELVQFVRLPSGGLQDDLGVVLVRGSAITSS